MAPELAPSVDNAVARAFGVMPKNCSTAGDCVVRRRTMERTATSADRVAPAERSPL